MSTLKPGEGRLLDEYLMDALDRGMAFERLLADVATKFASVATAQLDELIPESLRRMGEALELDRCGLWQFTKDQDDLVHSHGWGRPGVPLTPPGTSAKADCPEYFARLKANEVVWDTVATAVTEGDQGSSDRPVSIAVVPIGAEGRLVGALCFASLRTGRAWKLEVLDRMRLVAAVLGQGLVRRENLLKLERALAEAERMRNRFAADGAVHRPEEVGVLRSSPAISAGSGAMRRSLALVASVAPTDASVLLHGETGSGKELFAQEIHRLSRRADRPMVHVNCAAIPTALLESELFGRERGAYTGALSRQAGRFELASGTTIFLDEVGELPLDAQAKLLRVLQEKTIERLGGTKPIPVDVRVIAATNRDLAAEVAERTFREDLFYRLNVFPIQVPPLRERIEDIPDLAWTFVDEFARAFHKRITSISHDSLEALQRYAWPGNVRELRNLIERAVIMATGPRLVVEPPSARGIVATEVSSLFEVEALHIRGVLERTGWRVRGAGGAAEILDMNPTTLDSRMARLGIRRPVKRSFNRAVPAAPREE